MIRNPVPCRPRLGIVAHKAPLCLSVLRLSFATPDLAPSRAFLLSPRHPTYLLFLQFLLYALCKIPCMGIIWELYGNYIGIILEKYFKNIWKIFGKYL